MYVFAPAYIPGHSFLMPIQAVPGPESNILRTYGTYVKKFSIVLTIPEIETNFTITRKVLSFYWQEDFSVPAYLQNR